MMPAGGTATTPVRLIQVGAGSMGRAWLGAIERSPDAELVGLVDLDLDAARSAAEAAGRPGLPVAVSVSDLASRLDADAVVNVTVPPAHHPVSVEAMFTGLPVLCEKPIAPTVAQALSMVAAAEASGKLLMISQSRRYFASIIRFRQLVSLLGHVGTVSCEFFRAPRFGGFREQMEHPLLVDMAIHHLDAARYLVGDEPVTVTCDSYNPPWSWYAGDAAATAVFELAGGARFVYNGSWCAPGAETSWNGRWRISAEHGTATWDGDHAPALALAELAAEPVVETADGAVDTPEEVAGALAEFVQALRTGTTPDTVAHRNVLSLAMVEAAVQSAATRQRVVIGDVLQAAHALAIRNEQRADLRAVLESWTDVPPMIRRRSAPRL